MREEDTLVYESDDGMTLRLRCWRLEEAPRGVILVSHGMMEHSARYSLFAAYMASAGYETWALDHRGHGRTADGDLKRLDRGSLLGHVADENAFSKAALDLVGIERLIAGFRPKVPLFLFGHSWGSFLARARLCLSALPDEKSGHTLAGCILSGTKGRGGFELNAGQLIANILCGIRGPRHQSTLLWRLADGAYAKAIKERHSDFDWISRDTELVKAYIADPLCGFRCSAGFYRDLIGGLRYLGSSACMENMPKNIPLFLIAGGEDPVGGKGSGPKWLGNYYKSIGCTDVETIIYPDARHELINETNRDKVLSDIRSWLDVRTAPTHNIDTGNI